MAGTILIGLPWHKFAHPLTAFSVMGLLDRRRMAVAMVFGNAFVIHSRNKLATNFLKSDHEWLLMIDDDMIVPFGDAEWYKAHCGFPVSDQFAGINAIDQMLSRGKTLIGALYFGKHTGGKAVYSEAFKDPKENAYAEKAPMDVVKPTRWVGTGCILIHRSVFEDINKKYPFLAPTKNRVGQWFSPAEQDLISIFPELDIVFKEQCPDSEKLAKIQVLLQKAATISKNNFGLGIGEDVQFCIRAAAAGHIPHVDMSVVCGHAGWRIYNARTVKT